MKTTNDILTRFLMFTLLLFLLAGLLVIGSSPPGKIEPLPKWRSFFTHTSANDPGKSFTPAIHYHSNGEESPPPGEPFCSRCHLAPPHHQSPFNRAILNHHSTRMHCLICHCDDFPGPRTSLKLKDGLLWPVVDGKWLDEGQEETLRKLALEDAPCFSREPECSYCHGPSGYFDFKVYGYDEKTAKRLRNLEEYITASPDKKWFLPSIR